MDKVECHVHIFRWGLLPFKLRCVESGGSNDFGILTSYVYSYHSNFLLLKMLILIRPTVRPLMRASQIIFTLSWINFMYTATLQSGSFDYLKNANEPYLNCLLLYIVFTSVDLLGFKTRFFDLLTCIYTVVNFHLLGGFTTWQL